MYTMKYDIQVGNYKVGMLDKVEIHRSVELLADTAKIVLPGAQYNVALDVEQKIARGNMVSIMLGYEEEGLIEEFSGYLQRISTDDGSITLECEDDLFLFRKDLPNEVLKQVTLENLLKKVVAGTGAATTVECTYQWTYSKFVINNATGYDVLRKVQEESGADIYLKDGVLHIHPPGEVKGKERKYDFAYNIESADLTYRNARDKKMLIVVKANMPDGTVKELEVGTPGGEKVEVKAATSDQTSMQTRGETELKRRNYDGYEGSITGWLIPECVPGDTVALHDEDYPQKDGTYFVTAVTTEFSESGGKRKIELGFKVS